MLYFSVGAWLLKVSFSDLGNPRSKDIFILSVAGR